MAAPTRWPGDGSYSGESSRPHTQPFPVLNLPGDLQPRSADDDFIHIYHNIITRSLAIISLARGKDLPVPF